MAKYINRKPSIIGLNVTGEGTQGPTTVNPGEVFEAEKDQIPKHYFDQGWVEEYKGAQSDKDAEKTISESADRPIPREQLAGPNPVQGSGTSMEKSETDEAAKKSHAYDRGSLQDRQRNIDAEADTSTPKKK